MKASLHFNLPDEESEFTHATNGLKYHTFIFEFDNKLRSMQKYQDVQSIAMDELRTMFYEMLNDYGISE
jgi:hypothetical protein